MNDLSMKDIRKMIEAGKESEVPEEDLRLYYENMDKRNHFELNEKGVKNLYCAICMQSISDYKNAFKRLRKAKMKSVVDEELQDDIDELEKFFQSDFFKNVVGNKSKYEIIVAARRIPEGGYNYYLKRKHSKVHE